MEIEYFLKNTESFLQLLNSQLEHLNSKLSKPVTDSESPFSLNYVDKKVELIDFDNSNFLFSRIDMMLRENPTTESLINLLQKYKDSSLGAYYRHYSINADIFQTKIYIKALNEFQEHLKGIEEYSIEKGMNS